MDGYRTLAAEACAEFTERRSRFIGRAAPVSTEEEALRFLSRVRAGDRDASHHAFAYLLKENGPARCSDDGEPQGTAGQPVMNALARSGAADAVVVVTRYFGGVLLGAGGLVRAYSKAASLAVAQAGLVVMRACVTGEIACSYSQYGKITALLAARGGVEENAEFTDAVRIRFRIGCGDLPAFQKELTEATGGSCGAAVRDRAFFPEAHGKFLKNCRNPAES